MSLDFKRSFTQNLQWLWTSEKTHRDADKLKYCKFYISSLIKDTLVFDIGLSVIPIPRTHILFILRQILWLKLTLIKHIVVYEFPAASNCISFVLFIVEI